MDDLWRIEQEVFGVGKEPFPDCTGIVASWCPVCGDCTCPRDDQGEVLWHYERGLVSVHGIACWSDTAKILTHWDTDCPLHGKESDHAL